MTELIADYVRKNWQNDNLAEAVDYSNRRMRENGGFTDFSKSNTIKGLDGEIMYAAFNPHDANVCTPVINQRRIRNAPVTMLEGPTLTGLVPVAERFKTKELAHDHLIPIHQISQGSGSFEEGLSIPTVYVSRKGNVKVSYDSDGSGKGRAFVSVTDNNYRTIVNQEVDVVYDV